MPLNINNLYYLNIQSQCFNKIHVSNRHVHILMPTDSDFGLWQNRLKVSRVYKEKTKKIKLYLLKMNLKR